MKWWHLREIRLTATLKGRQLAGGMSGPIYCCPYVNMLPNRCIHEEDIIPYFRSTSLLIVENVGLIMYSL